MATAVDFILYKPEKVAAEEDEACDGCKEGGGEGEDAGEDYRVTEITSEVIHDVTSLDVSSSRDPILVAIRQTQSCMHHCTGDQHKSVAHDT